MLAIVFELWGAVTAVRGSWAIQGVLGEGNYANHVRNHQQANRSLKNGGAANKKHPMFYDHGIVILISRPPPPYIPLPTHRREAVGAP